MAQTFFPITPVGVTPSANGWQDVNVSAYVPSGATGVVVHIENINTSSASYFGIRKNGSTDNRYPDFSSNAHQWALVGVDSNRVFEIYLQYYSDWHIYLVGYTMSGVTFFTNAYNKSLTATAVWTDINCATEAPNAIGLIWELYSTSGYQYGLRKNGSSDDRYTHVYRRAWPVIGCDASQICEGKIENTDVDFFLIGYITDGCTFNTNATDVSLGTTGSWIDLSALPSGANMGFIEVYCPGGTSYAYGLRKNGSSENIYRNAVRHPWAIVECDDNRIIEGEIANTVVDFFVVGYSTVVTEKTVTDTGSGAEAKASGNPVATYSRSESGSGVEALFSRMLGAAEAGSGAEAWSLLATLVATGEAGAGAEFATKLFSSADSGSGVESLSSRLLATSEIGTGTETLLSRLLRHTDSGLGADAGLTLLATLARAETGSGVDIFIGLVNALATSDTGLGIDKLLGRAISLLDTGSGQDVATLRKVFLSTDSGVGLEALTNLLALILTTEAGSASEQLRAKIMTSAGATDMKLLTKMGKARIPFKGVNL